MYLPHFFSPVLCPAAEIAVKFSCSVYFQVCPCEKVTSKELGEHIGKAIRAFVGGVSELAIDQAKRGEIAFQG